MKASILCILIPAMMLTTCFVSATCPLPVPTGLKLKHQTSCSVDVSWSKVNGSKYYMVRYKLSSDTAWTMSSPINGHSTTIEGLMSGSNYDFAVASYCADSTTAGFSVSKSKKTKNCSTPDNIHPASITASSADIEWTPVCGSSNFVLQYRKLGESNWIKVKNIADTHETLTNLLANTTYEYRVQADCGDYKSAWSATQQFTTSGVTTPKRNMLLFVLDDGRYDEWPSNGAPSWFVAPAVTKIASEGVNFKLTIPATSQCSPSRATIYTGLYPHINGVEKNGDALNDSLPLIQQILKDNGYYTGFIGKYGQYFGNPKGFDWWAESDGDVYVNANYTINGTDTVIDGHITDVYSSLAKTFFGTIPEDKNWVLFFFTRVPHIPTVPRPQDSTLYLNDTMPFPSNFVFYSNNYPSFYEDQDWNYDSLEVVNFKRERFQTLKGADDNMDSLQSWIIARDGTLDSTLILFMSDNGYLLGEHHMHEKIVALEESFRVPLFARYPAWFAPNTIIQDEFASNLDIASTLLDFAGLPDTFGFQGLSLHALADGDAQRKNFFYETGWDPYVARLRAVRTLTDVYIRSYCKTTTEEYYDLVNDPLNNTNLIFDTAYAATIEARRTLLDSLRTAFMDEEPKNKTCNLVTDGERITEYADDETPAIDFAFGPNPASEVINIYFTSHSPSGVTVTISNSMGVLMWKREATQPVDLQWQADVSGWNQGVYLVKAEQDGKVFARQAIVIR